MLHIFTLVSYTSDDRKYYDSLTTYESGTIQCILNDSENAHIWSILPNFIPGTLRQFLPNPETDELTIGGLNQFPHSIGNIKVSWLNSVGTAV